MWLTRQYANNGHQEVNKKRYKDPVSSMSVCYRSCIRRDKLQEKKIHDEEKENGKNLLKWRNVRRNEKNTNNKKNLECKVT